MQPRSTDRYQPIIQVLFIENDREVARVFLRELAQRQIYSAWVETLEEATRLLETLSFDLVLGDGMFPLRLGEAEGKGFLALMDYLAERRLKTPIVAWSNSTHVHEFTAVHSVPSFSKIELTPERFAKKGREYVAVETKSAARMADYALDRLVELSGLPKLVTGKTFVNYYEEPLTVLAAFMAFDMRTSMFAETAGLNYGPLITEIKKGVGTVYVDPANDREIAESIYHSIVDKEFFPVIEQGVRERAEALLAFSRPLVSRDYAGESDDALAEAYLEFVERFMQMRSYSSLPTAMEHETNQWTEHLTKLLKSKVRDTEEFNRAFSVLTSPEKSSYINEFEVAVARIGLAQLGGGDQRADRERLLHDWAWVKYAFEGEWLTLADIDEKIQALGGTREALKGFLQEFQERPARLQREKQAVIERYQLTPAEVEAFRIGAEIVFIKFFRKGVFAESYYSVEFLLAAIGQRIGLARKQMVHLLPNEVLAGLKLGKFPGKLVDQRVASSVLFSTNGRTYAFAPTVRFTYASAIEARRTQEALRGQTAYPGLVTGTARIVNAPADMGKLRDGEILISRSTNPSLVPAMRRAAAFVTDLGGLTCHAAIVAREMKKPCIVGTKSATQQLKDGDQVTVDANKGAVLIQEAQ